MENGRDEKGRDVVRHQGMEFDVKSKSFFPASAQENYDIYIKDRSTLNDYINVMRRRKRIVLTCLIISVFIVCIASFMMDKVYRASATIEIAPEDPKVTGFEELMKVDVKQQDEFYETQYQLLKSRSLGRTVIESLDLQKYPEFYADEEPSTIAVYIAYVITYVKDGIGELSQKVFPDREIRTNNDLQELIDRRKNDVSEQEELVDEFLSRVEVTPDRESRLVKVSFDSTDPKLSAQGVNTLADEYIEWVLEKKLSLTKSAGESLKKQLKVVKEKLEKTQEELNRFAKKWDIVSLDKDLNLTYKQLAELNDALAKAETERLSMEALYEQTKAGNHNYLPQVVESPAVQQLKAEYIRLKSQYDNLDARYGENYPEMKQVSAQLTSVRSEMGGQLDEIVRSIRKKYETAKKKEDMLRQRAEIQKDRTAVLNEKGAQYLALKREVDTNKGIYQNLLQRLKETEVTSGIRATNVQVIDYAFPPLRPYKPNILLNILVAAVMGGIGGIILAFGFEHFDRTIHDEDDIKRKLPVPFMGKIPRASRGEIPYLDKIVSLDPQSKISEAFRVLKTSVMYSSMDHRPPKTLMVTSTQPLEGKTTISSNLALTMVQSGLKVILIDADLRRPRLHKVYLEEGSRINGVPGLSSYLGGEVGYDKIIHNADIDGLDVVPAGPIMPNPADLIDSEGMKNLIEYLAKRYDHVILDGIPVMELADARLLSRQVDSVLLVASVGIVDKEDLKNSMEELIKVGARILGVVVNRLDLGGKFESVYDYYYVSDEGRKKTVRFEHRGNA